MDREGLLALARYDQYAMGLVLAQVAHLSEDDFTRATSPSRESVRTLVLHIAETQLYFLAQCQGQPFQPLPTELSLAELQQIVGEVARNVEAFLAGMDEAAVNGEMMVKLGPREFRLPMWQVWVQAFLHGVHHRGELSIVMSHLGQPLPTIDVIVQFVKESGHPWFQ